MSEPRTIGNLTSVRRLRRQPKNQMEIFDALPADLRRALHEAVLCWGVKGAAVDYESDAPVRKRLAHLRRMEAIEMRQFARAYEERFGPYPHLAARATIQRYGRRA